MKWFCGKHPYPIKRKYSLFYHKLQFVSVQFITIFFSQECVALFLKLVFLLFLFDFLSYVTFPLTQGIYLFISHL